MNSPASKRTSQPALRLDEIRSEEEGISRTESAPDLREELVGGGRIEVSDVRPEEEDEHRSPASPGGRPPQPLLVGRAMSHDRDVLEAAESSLGLLQGRGRDVDQMDRDWSAPAAQRLGE